MPVDNNYNPLCNAITWLDRRSVDALNNNKKLLNQNVEFYKKTGWRLDSDVSFMPVYWLKENKKEIFSKVFKIMYVNDFILQKITGNSFQDPSNSSITLFYNIKKARWDEDILSLIDFNEDNFSIIKNPGEFVGNLKREICNKLNIKSKVGVYNGAHDQYCAGLGSGLQDDGDILIATGTAWVIFKLLKKPVFNTKEFFSIGRFSKKNNKIKDIFGLIYSIPAAGASIKWFAESVMNLKNEKELIEIENKNYKILAGLSNNIIFYPYLTGSFGPNFDLNKKAAFINLELGNNYLDLLKSIMEGVGFQLEEILKAFREMNIKIKRIKMIGGATKSRIWPQIISDIIKNDIYIPINKDEDFAAKGAAIIAGYGSGIFSSIEDGCDKLRTNFKKIGPKVENIKYYQNKFKLYDKSF